MRTRAVDENGNIVFISDAEKGRIYFDDMFPESELIPVKGEIRQWHYRYRDGSADRDTWANEGNSMSEWHIQQQNLFPENEREVPVFPHRADVLTGGNTVIEFQHSPISAAEIKERTDFYIEKKGAIIWVIDGTGIVEEIRKDKINVFTWFKLTKRSFIGGIDYHLRENQEVFIYTGWKGSEYIHVVRASEKWESFLGSKLGTPNFLMMVEQHIPNRVSSVVNFWKSITNGTNGIELQIKEQELIIEKKAMEDRQRIEMYKQKQFNDKLEGALETINNIVKEFKQIVTECEKKLHENESDPYFFARMCVDINLLGEQTNDSGRNKGNNINA